MPRFDPSELQSGSSDLEELIGYNLKRAYVVVQNDYRDVLGEDHLAPRMFSALSLTMQYENLTQSDLARMLGIERSGLVAIVDDLEARGFLARTSVPGDRRVQALVPTENGRGFYDDMIAKVRAHEAELFSEMTRNEIETLMQLLKKIRRGEKRK